MIGLSVQPATPYSVVVSRPGGPLDHSKQPWDQAAPSVTTGLARSADFVAVRLSPAGGEHTLSNRLLVIPPTDATTIRLNGVSVPVIGGAAVVTAPLPGHVDLIAVDAGGHNIGTLTVAEPDADGWLFSEPLFDRWW